MASSWFVRSFSRTAATKISIQEPFLSPGRRKWQIRPLSSPLPAQKLFRSTLTRIRFFSSSSCSGSGSGSKHPLGFTPPSTADLAELRERVQEFTRREISETVAASTDQNNDFPAALWKRLGDAGFLGMTASEEYGGMGMGYQAHCVVMEEISRASGSIGLSYAAHSQLCVNQISLNGTTEQKKRFLPGLTAGDKIGALAMSEHSAGSDVVSMKMTAAREDRDGVEGWLLNGTKMWITNGPDADYVVVYAKTAPEKGAKGITAFIVEKESTTTATSIPTSIPTATASSHSASSASFTCSRKLDKLGMRGSNTGELVFTDHFVPSTNILGSVNDGVGVLMQGLDLERLVLSAGPLGIMHACLDLVLPYTHTRTQFDRPIAHNQLVQGKLADMYTRFQTARAFTYAVAREVDEEAAAVVTTTTTGDLDVTLPSHSDTDNPSSSSSYASTLSPPPSIKTQDCAATILYSAERATECALDAIQLLGGNGYVNELPAGRLLRDAKLYEIGAGTSEIRRLIIGRAFNKEFSLK